MTGYTKLFGLIVASSVWDEDNDTRIVWITLLALKDKNHVTQTTEKALSLFARVSPEACRRALDKLEAPDPNSRSMEHEGRRIRKVEGGWQILNGEKYARMLTKEERREYQRNKQAEYRKRKKQVANAGAKAGARKALSDGIAEQRDNPPTVDFMGS